MKTIINSVISKLVPAVFFMSAGMIPASAAAATIFDFTISTGVSNVTGGVTGGSIDTLAINGTFKGTFTDTTVQFSDVNVSTSPSVATFVFPEYGGAFDGASFNASGVGANNYFGGLSGSDITIHGLYIEPFSNFEHAFTISANGSPVPLPGALLLLLSGLGLLGVRAQKVKLGQAG